MRRVLAGAGFVGGGMGPSFFFFFTENQHTIFTSGSRERIELEILIDPDMEISSYYEFQNN